MTCTDACRKPRGGQAHCGAEGCHTTWAAAIRKRNADAPSARLSEPQSDEPPATGGIFDDRGHREALETPGGPA
jgi:hypothetical protein